MIGLVLFAALSIPPQQSSPPPEVTGPVAPEQVLAWLLEGLTQEEIRDEVRKRGLTEYPEIALLRITYAIFRTFEEERVWLVKQRV